MNSAKRQSEPLLLILVVLFIGTPLLLYMPSLDSVVLPKIAFMTLLTGLLLATVILHRESQPRGLDDIRTPLDIPLLAMIAVCALSIWLKGESLFSVPAFRLMISGFVLVYLLIYAFRRRPEFVAICRHALTTAAVLVAAYIVLQDYKRDPLGWAGGVPDWRGHLPGTMGNPNAVAGFTAVLMPTLVFQFWMAKTDWQRLLMGVGLTTIFMAMVVTFSVGAWLGIVFGGLLSLWILRKENYSPLSWPAWATVVAVIVGIFLYSESSEHHSFMAAPLKAVSGRVAQLVIFAILVSAAITGARLLRKRFQIPLKWVVIPPALLLIVVTFYFTPNPWNGREGSILDQARASDRWKTGAGARRFIWKTTAIMLEDDPVFGIGFGRYFKVHAAYQGRLYERRGTAHDRPTVGKVPQVHNEFYQQMAETGLVGSIPFFWLVLAIIGLWKPALKKSGSTEQKPDETNQANRAWIFAAVIGLGIFMIHALTSFPLRRPSTWLAGAFLLAQIVAAANPLPAKKAKANSEQPHPLVPLLRVAILVAVAFHVLWVIRPVMASVHLKLGMSSGLSHVSRLEQFSKAISWNPRSFDPHFYAALGLKSIGRPQEAIQEAEFALRDREDLEARRLISDAWLEAGDYAKSASAWDEVLKINPCYPPFLMIGAERNRQAGNLERANELRKRALQLDPQLEIR